MIRLTERQRRVFDYLWTHPPATTGELALALQEDLAYTEVYTALHQLEQRDVVDGFRPPGNGGWILWALRPIPADPSNTTTTTEETG